MLNWRGVFVVLSLMALMTIPGAQAQEENKSAYQTTLSGKANNGDPDGTGTAKVEIDTATNELCYELTWSNIDEPTDAMIHDSSIEDEDASMLIDFDFKKNGPKGCVPAEESAVSRVTSNPGGHHVEIHNREFPEGAMRGQLSPA